MMPKLNKGNLLIADPTISNDNSFNRAIILLTEHNEEGSVGFIINKPTEYLITDLIPELNSNHIVYNGGPVSNKNLYFIHRIPHLIPNSIAISDGIYWAGDFRTVQHLLETNTIDEKEIRFFLGYTGWEIKQLKDEIKETSWIVKQNKFPNILTINATSFWRDELIKLGGDYPIWANTPQNPNMN